MVLIVNIQRNSGFGEWIYSFTDSSQIYTPFSKMSNENGSVLQFRLPLYMIIWEKKRDAINHDIFHGAFLIMSSHRVSGFGENNKQLNHVFIFTKK